MAQAWKPEDWEILVERINDGECVPFLGAGACYGTLPLGGEIASGWAKEFGYPLADATDLVRVAQFIALERDPITPKKRIVKMFAGVGPPDFSDPHEPHGALAKFPLPVYLTTNYDDFMFQALKHRRRDALRELCRWNRAVADHPSVFDQQPDFKPSVAQPIVFHLHGHTGNSDSLVLTEDDYVDFLVNLSSSFKLLPRPIENALVRSSLLFIGYSLADLNFRVLLRSLTRFMEAGQKRRHFAVMLPPAGAKKKRQRAQDYLTKFYENLDVRVYWGTAREFLQELQELPKPQGPAIETLNWG